MAAPKPVATDAELEKASVICVIKDRHGAFAYTNVAMKDQFPTSADGFIGKTDYHLMPDRDAAAIRANDSKVMDGGKDLQTVEVVHVADVPTYFLVHKFLIATSGQPFLGVLSIPLSLKGNNLEQARQTAAQLMESQAPRLRPLLTRLAQNLARTADGTA